MSDLKYRNDFDYVTSHFDQFFQRAAVRSALNRIYDLQITGWEKWWQIEFVTWLAEHQNIGGWVMEEKFAIDGRTANEKNHISIDIGFRLKGFSTKEFLFLELKQHADWRRCIANMLSDSHKVFDSRKKSLSNSLEKRSFFVCGVYEFEDVSKSEINDYILIKAEDSGIHAERSLIHTRLVRGTPFGFTIF